MSVQTTTDFHGFFLRFICGKFDKGTDVVTGTRTIFKMENKTTSLIMCDEQQLREIIFSMLDEYREELRLKEESFITTEQVCNKYGVSKPTLWRWDKSGKLKAKRLGRKVLYSEASIIKAMEE